MCTHLGPCRLLSSTVWYQVAIVYRLSLGQAVWHHGTGMAWRATLV